jgi:hypothetical protein
MAAVLSAAALLATTSAALADNPPPGDIPDGQTFVAYSGQGYTLKVPDGWARRGSGSSVSFIDKYNTIRVDVAPRPSAPTIATVRQHDLKQLAASTKGFASPKVSLVDRTAGRAVLITYEATSAPNQVTGKTITDDMQRYEFWHRGKLVSITMATPHGSDNVDAYRLITNSLRWRP